jgi:phage/plasmid-like protein (TIGR03299 family)
MIEGYDDPTSPNYDPTFKAWGTSYDVAENKLRHGLDETVNGGAFAAVNYGAWHELGTVMDRQCTALELLRASGNDYPIYRTPVLTGELVLSLGEIDGVEQTVRYAAVADERNTNIVRIHPETNQLQVLGQASDKYPLWTPRQVLVGFGDAILGTAKPNVSTCGALDGGRRVFMSFELPEEIRVGGMADESVRLWLTVQTSFDQSTPTGGWISPIRTVCLNTVRAGQRAALSKFSFRKTNNADLQAAQAREALDLVPKFREDFERTTSALVATTLTDAQFIDIIREEFGPGEDAKPNVKTKWDAKEEQLVTLFRNADTHANVRHTAWAGLQAVTQERDWLSKVAKEDPNPTATRFWRSLEGQAIVTNPKDAMLRRMLELAGV